MGLFEEQKKLNESLIQQLGNKTLSNKRITDENINEKRSEKKKGVETYQIRTETRTSHQRAVSHRSQ